jgi:hypothetical protein
MPKRHSKGNHTHSLPNYVVKRALGSYCTLIARRFCLISFLLPYCLTFNATQYRVGL